MTKMTVDDWAILKAMIQTVFAGLLLLALLYLIFTGRWELDPRTMIDLFLILSNGGSGVANLGKLRARNGGSA